jgi:hypothetical protein
MLGASHRSNRWALDASSDDCHPILAQRPAPDPLHLASWSIPTTRPAPLPGRLKQVLRPKPIRERAIKVSCDRVALTPSR